jgi:two-component system LytT family response regulator
MTVTAVVVEDQPLARAHLVEMLAGIDGVECVGEAGDGDAGLELLGAVRPDLVFLDIDLPGMSGIEVLRRATPRPWAIFTTGYDQHAVTAFELQAIDYVLKPFGAERLGEAVARALERIHMAAGAETDDSSSQVDRVAGALDPHEVLTRIFVSSRGRIVPLHLEEVEHLRAQGDYVELRTDARVHLVRTPLQHLLARLDPARFVRVHRSHAINLDHVAAFVPTADGRLRVELASGATVVTSRKQAPRLRDRLRLR